MAPDAPADFEPWSEERAAEVVAPLAAERGALLPIFHRLQEVFGFVPAAAVPLVADLLNWSQAEVYGVLTFYKDFRTSPPGRTVVRVCRAEACQSVGGEEVARLIEERVGTTFGSTSGDGLWTLESVYCLGNCSLGPSISVSGSLFGRVSEALVDVLLPIGPGRPEGPLSRRQRSAPPPDATRRQGEAVVYVPGDASAVAVGADEVAAAVVSEAAARAVAVRVVRNGSRGACWLEPLLEVVTGGERVGYGPVAADDVPSLFDAGFLAGGAHPLGHGRVDEMSWFARQTRRTFARVGVVDPLDFADFVAHGGLAGLQRALAMPAEQVVEAVAASGLRGRGGAGFPAGVKWRTVLGEEADEKFVCVNADEGDSGTFADRMLMEGDPLTLVEGTVIAGLTVGASTAYVYLRSEYPDAARVFAAALDVARAGGMLGPSVLGSGRPFDIRLRVGAGSYVCGEETAMLESLEGRRGTVRAKPPVPAVAGLFGKPTLVHNVLTLAAVPAIVSEGAAVYEALGTARSRGTQVVQLGGNVLRGGAVEVPFGCTLRELVEDLGRGTRSGRPVRAVQVGGPLGAYLPDPLLDTPLDYEALAEAGGMLGHGGVVVFDDTVDMARQARFAMEFCAEESCGKCTPCRVGSVRGVEVVDRILAGEDRDAQVELLRDLCETMRDGSLCAMGGLTPMPVLSALDHFPADFGRTIVRES